MDLYIYIYIHLTPRSHRSGATGEVLKDVRLRCTFASTDSGGISGQRLAVLDKYAHVLKEPLELYQILTSSTDLFLEPFGLLGGSADVIICTSV